jgi:CDP-4-dehydro-6-deoxyglucose reductase
MSNLCVHLVQLVGGKRFTATIGEPLLEAAARGGVNLPYSCKTGRCSTCKCKVLSGETHALHAETGLTEQEQSEGWVLSCARSAKTDVVLEVDDLGGIDLPLAKTWPCRISEINRLAPDVVQVLLRLPPTADFHFIPGQYIDVIGPNGIRRSYSLANANFANKFLELHIRALEGGAMSNYWFNQAKRNDLLRLNGPLGTFFLRETASIDLIFLATGTGIAPVKAMLESIIYRESDQRPRNVKVIWGGRHPQDLYMNVTDISGDHIYIPVLSRPSEDWAGAKGHVQDVLLNMAPDFANAVVYACGSDAMIHSAKIRLVEAGLPANRFYSDAFVSSGMN